MIKQCVDDGIAQGSDMPIIGNGDIITHYEAERRMKESGVHACMVGRGALIKPWIFQEYRDHKAWEPTLADRIEVYYRLTSYMKEYFGDDELGRAKTWKFLPWHFSFFSRYQPFPMESCAEASLSAPLIHNRIDVPNDATPLDILFYHRSEEVHERIADSLWNSDSSANALDNLQILAESDEFRKIQEKCRLGESMEQEEDTKELANVPEGSKKNVVWKGKKRRQRRGPKPDRTPEEIAAIRAERAAKKARLEAEQKALEASSA